MADGASSSTILAWWIISIPQQPNFLTPHMGEAQGHTFAEVIRHHQIIDLWRKCQDTNEHQGALMETSGENGRFLQVILTPFKSLTSTDT